MSEEIWKDIPDYDGMYQVSDLGNVRSFTNKKKGNLLKLDLGKHGYYMVALSKDKRSIRYLMHRVVYTSFMGIILEGLEINHKDGNKLNNHIDNLEAVTSSENSRHAHAIGLQDNRGENHSLSKLTNEQILEIRARYIPRVISHLKLSKEYGVTRHQILRIIKRKNWKHI